MILAAGLMRGLSRADAEEMTLGMWVDYIIEWNGLNNPKKQEKKQTTRKATQSDFDAF